MFSESGNPYALFR